MTNHEKRQLYHRLLSLREYFKEEGRKVSGRAPLVCTDYAVAYLADLCPKTLDELYSVPDIGERFVENYGEYFLEIIREYSMDEAEQDVEMTEEHEHILKELEKKLTSINSRNRLLYFSRLTTKTGGDLSSVFDRESIESFMAGRKHLTIRSVGDPEEESLYRRCRQVSREASKELREKGKNNLYIGYPFVKGRLSGENFDVRAPLILFPVEADATPEKIVFTLDDSRDIQYNSALILANYKFNGVKDPLPDVDIDQLKVGSFVSNAIDFYEKNYISINDNTDHELIKFEEYNKGTFPKYNNGELYIEPCAVLGRYPVCDNAIQKDFEEILEKGIINYLLEKLLEGKVDYEIDYDSYEGEFEIPDDDRELVLSERDLNYINDLNSSQEAVIKKANTCDALVVYGPPGTGKSQTIASLIADAATRGKTVLMVSEKKTALDVVYSRLGELSRYALLIDDVTNKNLFYKQLDIMLTQAHVGSADSDSLESIIVDIDDNIKALEEVAAVLYAANEELGTEPYKLYIENDKFDLEDESELETARILEGCTEEISQWDYPRVKRCYNSFARGDKLECCTIVEEIYDNDPLIVNIKEDLSTTERYSLLEDAAKTEAAITEYLSKGFFAKLFGKNNLNETVIKPFADKYLTINPQTAFDWLTSNIKDVNEAAKYYKDFHENKPIYDKLNEDELTYLKAVYEASLYIEGDIQDINYTVYQYILFSFIDIFERDNRALFHTINNFNLVVKELSKLINQKKKITKARLAYILQDSANAMISSKRGHNIRGSVDSRRRMSINRFINKYSFELFKYVKIWLLTPEVVSEIIPLKNGIFDLVVFDEASQMYVEKGIPSILRAKKVVVAGDSMQLRPSSLGSGRLELLEEDPPDDEDIHNKESLLDLAKEKYNNEAYLNFHYRSKYEELITFSNYAFYKARLYVSPNVSVPKNPPIEVLKINNGLWTEKSNYPEAKKVVELLKWIFAERKNNETIGIITFNITQHDMIETLIDEERAADPKFNAQYTSELNRKQDGQDIGVFVKNIERVQGDERDIIIFSVGYAKNENGKIVRNFGWLNQTGGENRLNVAVSRAKKKIYVVTSINPSELRVEDIKNKGPKYLRKYLEYAFAISNRDNETARNVLISFGDQDDTGKFATFDSDFELKVYNALSDKGYQVDTQVGIGGYSIDLAIKYDGNYILGIECDGKLYHSSKSARERDYHRQKYLESRGWVIHRIWSPNWWKDPDREIKKISKIVDSKILEIEEKKKEEKESADRELSRKKSMEAARSVTEWENENITETAPVPSETLSSTMVEKRKPVEITHRSKSTVNSAKTVKTEEITKSPKKPSKQTIAQEPKEKKSRANYHDIYPVTKSPKQASSTFKNAGQQMSLFDDDDEIERKCENCKAYRNDDCAGLKLCDSYEQVPGLK